MKWRTLPLDAIKASVPYAFVGGPFGSNLTTRDYVDEGVPVIRGNNLPRDASFRDEDFVFVSEKKADDLRSNTAYPGDVVFTQRGTLGQVGVIPRDSKFPRYIVSQSQMKLTVDPAIADARFVYYCFRGPLTVQKMVNHAITSGVPHINLGILKGFEISLPEVAHQCRIADVLSAYDDLIENNRRRMALLEDAARQLYREWFVRLRFPGHEQTHITDGLPGGWERSTTTDAVHVNPRTPPSKDAEHWFVEMADLPINSMVIEQAVKREGRSGSRFQNGDTLFARITPCLENGKTAFVDFMDDGDVGRGSTEFIVLRSKRLTPEYVYCLARTYAFRENAIKSMVGASGRQRVQEACFDKFVILVPPDTLLAVFTTTVRPMFHQIKALHAQNQKLRAAWSLLLPRLMSGQIPV